jgi:hypothetical protein
MLSISHKFLFIHVPKTGGNSIQNILTHYSEDTIVARKEYQDGIERFQVRNKRYGTTKHSPLSHYQSVLEPELYSDLFKFAVIRNPWDMMISYYFSPHRNVSVWDRSEFLEILEHVKPLRYYICESSPLSSDSSSLVKDIDFLIRFERLDEDFSTVCQRLNIPPSPLPQRNRSTREHYSRYYDDELKSRVAETFREEIEMENYDFEFV